MVHALLTAIERHHQQRALQSLALIDDLTGLHNRRGFLTLAAHHLKVAHRTGRSFLLVFVDLDGLKQVNDTFGHPEGNRALLEAADVLRGSFRQSDILGRLGGDEFVVLTPEANENSAEMVLSRLQEKASACNRKPGRIYALSLSVGIVAGRPEQACSLEELLAQADALMYEQKRSKRGPAERVLGARENQAG
jgi:diguanylate cyclase (GGDEF)-like protein